MSASPSAPWRISLDRVPTSHSGGRRKMWSSPPMTAPARQQGPGDQWRGFGPMDNLRACLIVVLPRYHGMLAAFVSFPRGALRIQTSGHKISGSITRPTFPAADVVLYFWFCGVLDHTCRIAGTLLISSKRIELLIFSCHIGWKPLRYT